MQQVASEMNVSETAFLHPLSEAGGRDFNLRWFTPTTEVELCGHATLASAHILWDQGLVPMGDAIRFQTASGLLTVTHDDGLYTMDFPAEPAEASEVPPALVVSLGVMPTWVGRNRLDYVAELASDDTVRRLTPDLQALMEVPGRGVMVTAPSSDPAFDYVCRVFGPKVGIPEDPVTGSAQCTLGPYWANKLGKTRLTAYQCSRRGGQLIVKPAGDRVLISGQAVTTTAGEIR
jgi:PhzF family phenazine biosynthesis protein